MLVNVKNRLWLHRNKGDNQITIKLWIIKTFWSIYLQDNHCWKDLNYQKKSLTFGIWIKYAIKCKSRVKKMSPKWTGTQTRVQHPKAPFHTFGVSIQHNFSHSLTPLFLALLFFSFLSYVKDVLEAFALGISLL